MPQAPPPAAAAPPPAPPPQAAPRRLPAAAQLPIDPDLPADQPLEPGSGRPTSPGNPAARIAASEAALGGARPAVAAGAAGGKSSFIAAARRAAQAAGQDASARAPRAEPAESYQPESPSLRGKLLKRVKSLFVAASIIAIVVGLVQIAGNMFYSGNSSTKTAQAPASNAGTTQTAARRSTPELDGQHCHQSARAVETAGGRAARLAARHRPGRRRAATGLADAKDAVAVQSADAGSEKRYHRINSPPVRQ